jgi:hypothetical protein
LSFLPRPIYIFLIFQLSGLFHIFLYYPLHHEIVVRPYAIFYITQGLAMALERQYYKTTGRKVGGVIGWFWTWGVIALSGMPTVEHEYGIGWAGAMRGPFAEDRSNSMVEWLVYALGLGRHPKE